MKNRTYNLGNYKVPPETKGGICVDVGANLGDFTNQYKNHFKQIYYVEPQTELFENLEKRFTNSNNIIGYNNAVWDESNIDVNIVSHENEDCGSSGVQSELLTYGWTDAVINTVKTISYVDLLESIPHTEIDYMKIDCETSEYPFLIDNNLSNIIYIGIELHNQLPIKKYNQLIEHISKTHELIYGNTNHSVGKNKEVLYKRK